MASAGESGSPLLYFAFQCIGCGKSSPAPDSSISGDTAAQVSGRGKVQFAVLGLLRNHRNSGQAALLRYQNGLRQRDVADYAGIDRSTYVHYEEYGKDSIRQSTWRNRAAFLKCRSIRFWMTTIYF